MCRGPLPVTRCCHMVSAAVCLADSAPLTVQSKRFVNYWGKVPTRVCRTVQCPTPPELSPALRVTSHDWGQIIRIGNRVESADMNSSRPWCRNCISRLGKLPSG